MDTTEARARHAGLAAARAGLAIGWTELQAGAWERAAAAAEQGLAELGDDYAPPKVEDSTYLKVSAARELLAGGQAENGARLLLYMLAARVALYVQRHRETIAG